MAQGLIQISKNQFWTLSFFGWIAILLVLSVIPSTSLIEDSNDKYNFRWDYIEHFGVFLVLGVLFGFWRRQSSEGIKSKKDMVWFLVAGGLFAIVAEALQLFVDGRTFNPVDIYCNLAGLLLGTLVSWKFILK